MDKDIAVSLIEAILSGKKAEGFEVEWTAEVTDAVGEKIAAFATSGGGWLVIGLSNDRPPRAVGIEDEQLTITKMGEVLRLCDPVPTVGEPLFVEKNGKKIAVYRILGLGGSICTYKETPYHRVQDSSKKMSHRQLQEVLVRKGVISWEQRPSLASLDSIDKDELDFYLKKANERLSIPQAEQNFLQMNRALTDDGSHLTNLGLNALCAKPSDFLPQCRIQLVRFRGTQPTERISAALLSLPARKLIEACENFLLLNLPVRERFEGTNRFEEPVVPRSVLREAIVNMAVHRDYSDPQESLIRIFDDRIELQNPGAPNPAEFAKILNQGIPVHRNPWVYNFLRPVHKAEAAGQGIPIMRKEMADRGLVGPEITTLANLFHLTLWFKQRPPENLEDLVLAFGKERRTVSTGDVMLAFKVSRPTAIRILSRLADKGHAEHRGERRGSRYFFK